MSCWANMYGHPQGDLVHVRPSRAKPESTGFPPPTSSYPPPLSRTEETVWEEAGIPAYSWINKPCPYYWHFWHPGSLYDLSCTQILSASRDLSFFFERRKWITVQHERMKKSFFNHVETTVPFATETIPSSPQQHLLERDWARIRSSTSVQALVGSKFALIPSLKIHHNNIEYLAKLLTGLSLPIREKWFSKENSVAAELQSAGK